MDLYYIASYNPQVLSRIRDKENHSLSSNDSSIRKVDEVEHFILAERYILYSDYNKSNSFI